MLPRATDYHRKPMRLLNAALRAVRPLGLARLDPAPDKLLAAARRETGLEDFGDEAFLERELGNPVVVVGLARPASPGC